jgi:hypothetical protein
MEGEQRLRENELRRKAMVYNFSKNSHAEHEM